MLLKFRKILENYKNIVKHVISYVQCFWREPSGALYTQLQYIKTFVDREIIL